MNNIHGRYFSGTSKAEQGTALFLILIAVALFAALSYAVTQSSRGSGSVDKELAYLRSSEIVQYGGMIQSAITRLKLANGCLDTQISFENPRDPGMYVNPSAPANKSCHVFDPAGGNVPWKTPPSGFANTGAERSTINYFFTGGGCVAGLGTGSDSTCWNNGTNDDTELIMMVNYVSDENCRAYNATIKAGTPNDLNQVRSNGGSFSGAFDWIGQWGYEGGSTDSHHIHNSVTINGKNTLCFQADPAQPTRAGNHIYFTLIER